MSDLFARAPYWQRVTPPPSHPRFFARRLAAVSHMWWCKSLFHGLSKQHPGGKSAPGIRFPAVDADSLKRAIAACQASNPAPDPFRKHIK